MGSVGNEQMAMMAVGGHHDGLPIAHPPAWMDPGGQDPKPSLGWMCRHRPPLAGCGWVNVPSVLWYFRGHGRTIPDLEFLLIAVLRVLLAAGWCCAIPSQGLHPPPTTNPTPSNPSDVAAPPCPRHADRGRRGPARASAWATTGKPHQDWPAAGPMRASCLLL